MTPAWFSQPFPPEGASAAEGIRSQLGKPELDLLTILVREAAQNSWDAQKDDAAPSVDFRISLRTVSPAHANAWRTLLLNEAPLNQHLPLRASLQKPTVRVMEIADRGTRGLGGPTRADKAVTGERDFVSFVRNIGEPRDRELGGGTYGFGKGIFYLISEPGTILIHTRCEVDGGYETRLMGCALWESYVVDTAEGCGRYTGRHWWGDVSGDVVEPLVGEDADHVARQLGLRPFKEDETGTSIIVIDPKLDDRAPAEAADYLAETMAWHLWPKMLGNGDTPPPMRFSVNCDGIEHEVPDPRTTRPLNLFVAAYEEMTGDGATELWRYRPKKFLGHLGLEKRMAVPFTPSSASRLVGIDELVHHVCLMRTAELVVTYRPGPKPPSEFTAYAGVFRAAEELESVYARAEPPTHDAWNKHSLEGRERKIIETTFRRIDESVNGLLNITGTVRSGSAKVSLGAASRLFSPLVGGVWGAGGRTFYGTPASQEPEEEPETATPRRGRKAAAREQRNDGQALDQAAQVDGAAEEGQRAQRRRPRVEYLGVPYFEERSGRAVLIQDFRLPVPIMQRVRADVGVTIAGTTGRETNPPVGADQPELLGWEHAASSIFFEDSMLTAKGGDGVWRAVIRPVADTMTEIRLHVTGVATE